MSPDLRSDLDGHHIEGYARAAIENGDDGHFSVPLLSQITEDLWMGGCLSGVRLPDDFDFVVSLYNAERFVLGPTTVRYEEPFYDSADEIGPKFARRLEDTAKVVNAFRASGRTLVHCQAGLNRSGLVCALALMRERDCSAAEAIDTLRDARCPVVLCNRTFEKWLLAVEGKR